MVGTAHPLGLFPSMSARVRSALEQDVRETWSSGSSGTSVGPTTGRLGAGFEIQKHGCWAERSSPSATTTLSRSTGKRCRASVRV
eukprot:1193406-Prorocentrum_minimum.AAC.1